MIAAICSAETVDAAAGSGPAPWRNSNSQHLWSAWKAASAMAVIPPTELRSSHATLMSETLAASTSIISQWPNRMAYTSAAGRGAGPGGGAGDRGGAGGGRAV